MDIPAIFQTQSGITQRSWRKADSAITYHPTAVWAAGLHCPGVRPETSTQQRSPFPRAENKPSAPEEEGDVHY